MKVDQYGSGENFTVEFTFKPGYNPNALPRLSVFAFVGIDDESHALAQDQRTAAQGVIESMDGPDARSTY